MTSTSSTASSSRTGTGGRGRRAPLSAAQREAADAARAAKIAALHDQIGEQVEALTADPSGGRCSTRPRSSTPTASTTSC